MLQKEEEFKVKKLPRTKGKGIIFN